MSEKSTSSARLRILFLSHTHAFGPFRVGSHHYARQLADQGADVVHLSTPISLAHCILGRVGREERKRVPQGAHRDDAGVIHLIPRTVMPAPLGRLRVSRALKRAGIQASFDIVLIDQPLLWDDSVSEMAKTVIYRPTDLYPAGVKARIQQRIVRAVDGIVATSSEVLHGLGTLTHPTLVLANGVDVDHFASAEEPPDVHDPTCVYVGALDGRFDWVALSSWAAAHPSVPFLIAGPDPRPPHALPSNVELLGAVSYDAVPALLRRASVGLLPLSDDPLNAGRSPMKLYEYLAAGLAVLTRETPGIGDSPRNGVYAYRGPQSATAALARALAHPSPNLAGRRAARGESWLSKTTELLAFVRAIDAG